MTSIIKVDTLQKANGGTPTAADLGINTTGTILQVTKSVITSQVQGVSTTWLNTAHSLVITPKSNTSDILIQLYSGGISMNNGSPADNAIRFKRNGTVIMSNDRHGYTDDGSWNNLNWSSFYIDSPSSTSTLTYTVEIYGNRARFNDSNSVLNTSSFYAMEIAG